jgi:hypothetical protein
MSIRIVVWRCDVFFFKFSDAKWRFKGKNWVRPKQVPDNRRAIWLLQTSSSGCMSHTQSWGWVVMVYLFILFIWALLLRIILMWALNTLHAYFHHWLCYLGNTRVTTAEFWRRSVIFSFHSVGLHLPVMFSSFCLYISTSFEIEVSLSVCLGVLSFCMYVCMSVLSVCLSACLLVGLACLSVLQDVWDTPSAVCWSVSLIILYGRLLIIKPVKRTRRKNCALCY